MDNIPLTAQAHERVAQIIKPGDMAIDATAGNGHDTVFLAQAVGSKGRVYAFDIQWQAIANSSRRILENRLQNVTLYHAPHEKMYTILPVAVHGRIKAIMFNLGYLPGGDKSLITQAWSTITSLRSACDLLAVGGLITVLAYPRHPGGAEETDAVMQCINRFPDDTFRCEIRNGIKQADNSPKLICLYHQPQALE